MADLVTPIRVPDPILHKVIASQLTDFERRLCREVVRLETISDGALNQIQELVAGLAQAETDRDAAHAERDALATQVEALQRVADAASAVIESPLGWPLPPAPAALPDAARGNPAARSAAPEAPPEPDVPRARERARTAANGERG